MIEFPYIDDFCDDEVYVFSTIGQGPSGEVGNPGPQGPKGDKGDNGYDSLSYVGNYGAIEKDDSVDWQDIIDQIAAVSNTIDFGSGQWYVSNAINIPVNIRNIVASGAIITSVNDIDYIFGLTGFTSSKAKRFVRFDGIYFEANKCAKSCISVTDTNGNNLQVFNCAFSDYKEYGIYSHALGAFVMNCVFHQNDRGIGCAVMSTTDCVISSCKVFNNACGFAVRSARISDCYVYSGNHQSPVFGVCEYTLYEGSSRKNHMSVNVTNCEFDCLTYVFGNAEHSNIDGCIFYWNSKNDLLHAQEHGIFFETYRIISNINFTNCKVFISTSNIIDGHINSFVYDNQSGESTANIVRNYHSYGCFSPLLDDPDNNVLQHMRVSCGFVPCLYARYNTDGVTVAPNAYQATRFFAVNTTATNKTNYQIMDGKFNAIFNKTNLSANAKSLWLASNCKLGLIYGGNNDDMYVQVEPRDICEIILGNGCPYNMGWESIETEIDMTGMTRVLATTY